MISKVIPVLIKGHQSIQNNNRKDTQRLPHIKHISSSSNHRKAYEDQNAVAKCLQGCADLGCKHFAKSVTEAVQIWLIPPTVCVLNEVKDQSDIPRYINLVRQWENICRTGEQS